MACRYGSSLIYFNESNNFVNIINLDDPRNPIVQQKTVRGQEKKASSCHCLIF